MLRVLVLSTSGFFSLEAGRKLGKRHLHTLLDALGRDCLQGASDSAEKVSETFVSRRGPEGCSIRSPRWVGLVRFAFLRAASPSVDVLTGFEERRKGGILVMTENGAPPSRDQPSKPCSSPTPLASELARASIAHKRLDLPSDVCTDIHAYDSRAGHQHRLNGCSGW